MTKLKLTYIERLIDELDSIIPIVDTLLDNSSIIYRDPNDDFRDSNFLFFSFASKYRWQDKDEKTQVLLRKKYQKFYENFSLLLDKATPQIAKKVEDTNKETINLIEQNKAPNSIEEGKSNFRDYAKVFKDFLNLLTSLDKQILIVPDTNSIIKFPEPNQYCKIATSNKFQFVILPTVLSELDKLKITHRDDNFREKVKSVIKRLKGYRTQGDILEGIIINKTITIKMIATEPNLKNTLKWIDKENNDDRIIASVLELQLQNPSQNIIFVTSDVNLQNKAQMANLNFFDSDEM